MKGAIFVDGANVSHVAIELGTFGHPLRFDVVKFEQAIRNRAPGPPDFDFKNYYLNYRDDVDRSKLEAFVHILFKAGWKSVLNPCKEYRDGHYKDKRTDVTMVLDAMELILGDKIQLFCLMTHDADFVPFLERIPPRITTYVIGWKARMARELIAAAKPIYMEEFWEEVRR